MFNCGRSRKGGFSSLCELVCSVIEGEFLPASMFMMKQWYSTIGSQVRTLELGPLLSSFEQWCNIRIALALPS
jgi:hypothetical protein